MPVTKGPRNVKHVRRRADSFDSLALENAAKFPKIPRPACYQIGTVVVTPTGRWKRISGIPWRDEIDAGQPHYCQWPLNWLPQNRCMAPATEHDSDLGVWVCPAHGSKLDTHCHSTPAQEILPL